MAGNGQGAHSRWGRTFALWYGWFSHLYGSFARVMFFVGDGGLGGERRIRDQVISWLHPRPGERALDLCSGAGTLGVMIAERSAGEGEVVGTETSPHHLKVLNAKRNRRDRPSCGATPRASPLRGDISTGASSSGRCMRWRGG